MDYLLSKLKNNLRLLIVPIPTLESATVTVWAKTGSRYEESNVSGISHFLEHMAFKGGKKYKTAKDVAEAVDAIGGEFNAGTSKEWTNFYIRCRSKTIETAFDVLSDMLLSPSLKSSDIEKERGVIIEEINMYDDTPMYKISDIFEQLIFKGTSLGVDIIGSKNTVKNITRNDFVAYRKKHYFAENMLITVSGGVSERKVTRLANKYFGSLPPKKEPVPGPEYISTQTKPKVAISNKSKEQAQIMLGFPSFKLDNPHRYTEYLMSTILGQGMSSRLFTQVREKRGLAYAVSANVDHYIETGYIAAHAGVDPKRAEEAVKVIKEEFFKLASPKHGITNKELSKAKEFIKGHLALSLESTKAINNFFGHDELLIGKITTPEDDIKAYDKISIENIVDLARQVIKPEKINLAIIGPYKDKESFVKLVS